VPCQHFDVYGDLVFNDEKARLDNIVRELTDRRPGWKAYYIYFSGRGRRGRMVDGTARAERAQSYLITQRGLTAEQIQTIDGRSIFPDYNEDCFRVVIRICPPGAETPTAAQVQESLQMLPCPPRYEPPRRERRPRRPRRGRVLGS
jgi:hypothetical protein